VAIVVVLTCGMKIVASSFQAEKKKKNIEKKKCRVRKEFTSLFSLPHLG
jgi:hypothetical protein